MGHIRADGSSGKVEHRVDRDAEAAQILLDAAQSCFHAESTVTDVPEGGIEDLDPVAPFVPFLHAERIESTSTIAAGRGRAGINLSMAVRASRALTFKPFAGWVGPKGTG